MMSLALATCAGCPFATVLGILMGLAGLSTAILCLFALSEGALRRGWIGFTCGALLLAVGLWLVGFFAT